jgi:hypothetical protein
MAMNTTTPLSELRRNILAALAVLLVVGFGSVVVVELIELFAGATFR